jgi:hypothetical protein
LVIGGTCRQLVKFLLVFIIVCSNSGQSFNCCSQNRTEVKSTTLWFSLNSQKIHFLESNQNNIAKVCLRND